MTTLFAASLVLAALALTLIVLLMWRARRVKVAAASAPAGRWHWAALRDGWRQRYAVLERAVRYVLARRDWRYRCSWLLLMGLPGDGKSSLAASIPRGLLRQSFRKNAKQEAYLSAAVANTQWHYLEQGVLIDPDSTLGTPLGDAAVDLRRHAMLRDIDSLRPDRALDGIVWVIAAPRLLATSEAALHALASHAFMRINEVQEQFAFALPVYVVVSQCDAVTGFDPFWKAQDDGLRREMIGWSAPTIDDNGLPADWVERAFAKLIEGLRELVLASAATHEHIDDVDDFFLFPQRMRALQSPLQRFLEVVFKPNVYETRAFCRGIYFTGAVAAGTSATAGPRGDLAFVEGLLRDKAFAERGLAQRTQKGLLARNRLIRRLQLGTVSAGLVLAAALPWTAGRLRAHALALHDTVISISVDSEKETSKAGQGCADQARVYALVERVAALDTRMRYVALPLSWVDPRISHGLAGMVATNALRRVVLPSMACRLQRQIDTLSIATLDAPDIHDAPDEALATTRKHLKQQLSALAALEDNLARFSYIAKTGMHSEHKILLQDFAALCEYVYGKPLPENAMRDGSALSDGLVEVTYADAPSITPVMRERLVEQFDKMAGEARDDLQLRVAAGAPLLASLKEDEPPVLTSFADGKPPVLAKLRSFNSWLHWVRSAWLLSTPTDNPCSHLSAAITPGIEKLINDNHLVNGDRYDASLRAVLLHFDIEQCYEPAVSSLRQATLPSSYALFTVNPQSQVLQGVSPGLESEAAGLKALAEAGFMQLHTAQSFDCAGAMGGWRSGTFDEVLSELRDYQLFIGRQNPGGRDPPNATPLYQKLAHRQLEQVIEDSLARNLRKRVGDGTPPGLDAVSQLDNGLSGESADLSAALGPLVQSLQQMRQVKLDKLADDVGQCARNYASGMLLDVSGLASASDLYNPPVQSSDDNDAAVFDLGPMPVLQAYLDRQLARAQVLSGYAAPFVTLLKNSRGVSDSYRLNAQTDVYWDNTISELNRAIQLAETSGQVAKLNDLFLKQLDTMNYANCGSVLDAYRPAPIGNDFFSLRRQAMEDFARMACADHGQAGSDMHFFRIAMLFNSELAGRYPFGPEHAHEVSLATVKAFFVYYAKEKPELETWLATAKGVKAARMQAFISQLDTAQAFFAGNLSATPQSAPIVLDVGFRARPDASPASNQLIAWTLGAGGDKATWPGNAQTLSWTFGQPLSLDLQWADRSRFKPLPDPTQSDLDVSGYHAIFQASGPWALLHLLDAHRPTATAANALDPDQRLLEFHVPLLQAAADADADTGSARLYLTLKLSATDPATKALLPLVVPDFPQEAPVLWRTPQTFTELDR